jgi:leucyl aminopeptidase
MNGLLFYADTFFQTTSNMIHIILSSDPNKETSMNYTISTKSVLNIKTDCLCIPLFNNSTLCETGKNIDNAFDELLSKSIKRFDIESEAGKTFILPTSHEQIDRIVFIGMGDADKVSSAAFRKSCKALASSLKTINAKTLHIALNHVKLIDGPQTNIISESIQAIENSHYSFDQFKSKKAPAIKLQKTTIQCSEADKKDFEQSATISQAQAIGVKTAKDLGNLPGNVCTPSYLAEQAESLAKSNKKISVKVLEEADMEKLNMGAFLSVSKGSTEPGKLIIIEYMGGKKGDAPHMLVGKGITFDSGGISLKPGPQMDEMKYDMGGAASVMGTMTAIAEIEPNMNIVSLIASAENMPAGNASKPGDIVTTASGQTVEILNTDAEGRLVLCDALTYAEKFKPASVVDIATLTGACIVALGHSTSAVMGNNDDIVNELLTAGNEAGDRAWQLPLWDEYQDQLDSPFADMQNIGGKGAGSITAACFLSRYAKAYPWAHMDIAGTAWTSGKDKGSTGRPVPLLLNYLLNKMSAGSK